MKSFTWVISFWANFVINHQVTTFWEFFSWQTSYLGKTSTKIKVSFINTIFWSILFKGVIIGLELWKFDRMCIMGLVFWRWQKIVFVKVRVTRFWLPTNDMHIFEFDDIHVTVYFQIYRENRTYPTQSISFNSVSWQFVKQSVMGYFVKFFSKVHYNNIILVYFMHIKCYIMDKFNKLGFTTTFHTEAMLERVKNVVLVRYCIRPLQMICSRSVHEK